MPRTATTIWLMFAGYLLNAQDLIVTTGGDSIRCSITTIGAKRLFYQRTTAEGGDRADIPMASVAMYKREGYYPVVVDHQTGIPVKKTALIGGARWMMSFSGGFSRRLAGIPENVGNTMEDHIRAQFNGLHASASVHYFIKDNLAAGAAYSSFFGAAHSLETDFTFDDTTITGIFEEDVRLRWASLNVLFKPPSHGALSFTGWAGIGPLFYINHAIVLNKVDITGNTIAAGGGVGCDYAITASLALGVQASYMMGNIETFQLDFGSSKTQLDMPYRHYESINRVDLGLVMRIRL